MADDQSIDLLVRMVGDLNRKVDGMAAAQVTRHEFEQLTNRIDKFVLHTEFEQYKELAEARLDATTKTIATWQENHTATYGEKYLELERAIARKGRWPAWVQSLAIAIIAALAGGISGSYATSHFTPAQQVQTQHVGQP